jgi:hypothetical protein
VWGQGGEMTQALYAHMNNKKRNNNNKKNCVVLGYQEGGNILIPWSEPELTFVAV